MPWIIHGSPTVIGPVQQPPAPFLVNDTPIVVPEADGADPYGVDVAIDPSGDLRVTHSGSLGLVAGAYNMAQAVFLRLNTSQGDLPLHPEYGSQLAGRLIGAKMNPIGLLNELNSELRTMVSEDGRFTGAQTTQSQHPANGDPDSIQFGVQAQLAGGERLVLDTVADPSPSDVSLPQLVDPSADPTLAFDPLDEQEFFADDSEFDTLSDLDQLAQLVNDTTSPPTTP